MSEEEEFDIPVRDAGASASPAPNPAAPAPSEQGASEVTGDDTDWTWTQSVRDDPESLGAEARKLWDAVRTQFVEPLVHNYPEAVSHLASAGSELGAAVRSLIRGSEQLWAGGGGSGPKPQPPADVVEVSEDDAAHEPPSGEA